MSKLLERLRQWWRDRGLITCPTCRTTDLSALPGFGVYSQRFACKNGHQFTVKLYDDLVP